MRHFRTVTVVVCVLVFVSFARAQAPGNLVDLTLSVPQTNQIYVADLDIQHIRSSGILFSATLRSLASAPISVELKLTIDVVLANGSTYNDIAYVLTDPISLAPGQVKVITNVDLSGSNPTIGVAESQYNSDQVDQLKSVALATGKAPAGVYTFTLECLNTEGQSVATPQIGTIVVTNPSRIELALPMDQGTVSTLFPHFQWSSNVDTVVLSVYQKMPSQQSPEDVVSGIPFLRMTVPNPSSPAAGSFNYPPSGPGVRPLEDGRTYYWYIEVPASASRGSALRSDIWSFTVGSQDSAAIASGGGNINAAVTAALKKLLSETSYSRFVSQIEMLTGQATYDGSQINTQELLDILQNMDKSTITGITVH